MQKKPECLFFDSNVYINLLCSPDYTKKVEKFFQSSYLYTINKIVLMELWAGTQNKVEENILKLYQDNLPLIGLSDDHFITAGQTLSQLRNRGAVSDPKMRRRMTWDVLIALSAKENNAIIVTENLSDFKKIQRFVDFEFLPVE